MNTTSDTYLNRRPPNLVSIITPGYQSQPNQNQEELGQKYIEIYLHPLSKHLGFSEAGIPYTDINSQGRKPGDFKLVDWEQHAVGLKWQKGSKQPRYKMMLRKAVQEELGVYTMQSVARIALECYLNRSLESWEHACHINGIAQNNSKSNLRASDCVNNAIDELELGRQHTSLRNLLDARNRLTTLINNYETTH